MPTKPARNEMKEILKRLTALEKLIKNIPTTNLGYCVDFSAIPPGILPNPFTVNMTARTWTFSTTSPLGLEIKPNPPQYSPGLRIPSDLSITVAPSITGTVEFEVSSYASLTWKVYDSAGTTLNSIPAPPAPQNIGSHAVKINGEIERIEFFGNNEECIKIICAGGGFY